MDLFFSFLPGRCFFEKKHLPGPLRKKLYTKSFLDQSGFSFFVGTTIGRPFLFGFHRTLLFIYSKSF